LRQQNILLTEAKALMEDELNNFHAKLNKLGELQGENAALKVRVSSLEEEKEQDNQRMESLMQENAQLQLERDRNISDIESLRTDLRKVSSAGSNNDSSAPSGGLLNETELANHAKLLRLERDHRDLQRSYELYKQRMERSSSEFEKKNKKLNTDLHNNRKEIVRLKEVSNEDTEAAFKHG
jgi:hypothetical protein